MMSPGLVLLSDQMALERSLDVVANNIANSNTTGFKREAMQFDTVLSNLGGGASSTAPISFVYDRATYRDMKPGAISNTGNPLDLAIQGDGYFQVQTPQGKQYTRDGAFQIDNQGQIVTASGLPILSDSGQPIIIPDQSTDLTISGDGTVSVQNGTVTSRTILGKVGVVEFANNQALSPTGAGLYTTTQAPTPAAANNVIVEGALEQSNVQPVVEITDLIKIQRAYEQATNMISNENTRLDNAIDKLSQTS
ncbi:MAG: flagellar basal-body rod protein FlgF [Alphaproteobacteria bacterium]|nr:flagellar basal-body rod protein FlgF [Alphaproteobacteria bacterium]